MKSLIEIARNNCPLERIGVMHAGAEREAMRIADQLNDLNRGEGEILVTEIGPVVATHAGPGAVGICLVKQPM